MGEGAAFAGVYPMLYAFFDAKRQSAKPREKLKSAQEAWVRAALSLREQTMAPRDFAYVQWDYRSDA